MPRASLQQIYDALNYDWWLDNQINGSGPIFQSADLYFRDGLNNWHNYMSTGCCPQNPDYTLDPATRQSYVKNYLMWLAALWLENGQCAGGITNAKPASYQPMPIYFK